jgi:zinc protease
MQKFPLQLLMVATLFLFSCSHQSSNIKYELKTENFAGSFKVTRVIFQNGLKLLILKDPSSPTFAYQTWFAVGSRNEEVGKTGLAHLFEHMMFKGTKNYPEGMFDSILEQVGAEGENAFTSNDHTAYVQELPKKNIELIVKLESDRMTNLVVDEKSFKTEREVVQNERRFRKENSAEGTIYQTMFETAFMDNAYHWPVIGYEHDLSVMSAQDARDFYERFYSPDRATIVVVGDVDEKEVIHLVEKNYGKLAAKNTPDNKVVLEPVQTAQRRKKLKLNLQSQKLWFAYKIPEDLHPDTPAIRMLESILTDGMNSRLNRALVNSGIATRVNSGSLTLKDPGIFIITVDLQKGKDSDLAEKIILREIEQLKSELIPNEELQRAKNVNRYHFFQTITTAGGKANFLGEAETSYGNYEVGLKMQDNMSKITAEQIKEISAKYFNTEKLTIIKGVPNS